MGSTITKKESISIIFLDVDGVLNTQETNGTIDEEKVLMLKQIIDKSGAKIVISSSWRMKSTQSDTLSNVLQQYGLQWIGTTPVLQKYRKPERNRALEIESYLSEIRKQYKIEKWISLDDYNLLKFKRNLFDGHFVNTNVFRGLTAQDVQRAVELLS